MKNKSLKKVLVIGSGPIVIGQAAEFDYAGVQACRALKEEKIEVVLVNSNPATIMTDEKIASKVYIEPLTVECLTEIIKKERPQGLIATLGGQTALNLACELDDNDVLEKYNVKCCIYGHLHGKSQTNVIEGTHNNIEYKMVSCDHTGFKLVKIV